MHKVYSFEHKYSPRFYSGEATSEQQLQNTRDLIQEYAVATRFDKQEYSKEVKGENRV